MYDRLISRINAVNSLRNANSNQCTGQFAIVTLSVTHVMDGEVAFYHARVSQLPVCPYKHVYSIVSI